MNIDLATRISRRFDRTWREAGATPELAGMAVAAACRQELSVAGVGLSLLRPPWRATIGASNPAAVTAECLSCTVGYGPCHLAHERQRVVRATTALLNRRWPALVGQLNRRTPYRTVLSAPLTGWLAGLGTMSIYSCDDDATTELDPDHVNTVLDTVAADLIEGALGFGDLTADMHHGAPRTRTDFAPCFALAAGP